MRIIGLIAAIIGLITDVLTLITYCEKGHIVLPGNLIFKLSNTRIWILAVIGMLITAYLYSKKTGYWPFMETRDGKIPIQALFIVGPWILLACFATGIF